MNDSVPLMNWQSWLPRSSPEPTPFVPPARRHLPEKRYMLQLINEERRDAGVGEVVLGENVAAQLHAESALANCFSSHWGLDGLKPYMRYSLTGGYQSNGENGHGLDYCITNADGYQALENIRSEIREAMSGWMLSAGHRRNILDPSHKKVNIGIAWDRYNAMMFQHFEGDYVEYAELPAIREGILSFKGSVNNDARTGFRSEFGVQIFYDAPPLPLRLGQIARTYCYDNGLKVASLREPLSGGSTWATDQFESSYQPCPDPAAMSPALPRASSSDEAHALWREAYSESRAVKERTITVPWITARRFSIGGGTFSVEADISEVLEQHGPGVYSVIVWGQIGGTPEVISEYSIFHEIEPPPTYDLDRQP
ncbi:MAG: CAP domain-containing protein [Chloroflexota bacterium]|nr:CAP domain-containing protein [Chloroflexota bacterium]MDE2942060.1 CAP domain-containing protein [Chloroflexota bacterium]